MAEAGSGRTASKTPVRSASKATPVLASSGRYLLPCLLLVATAWKLLLVPSYRSTDFEVHRHWLALTKSLPLKEWYKDETSEWTLDYPPLFAWFERALAGAAVQVDPVIVDLKKGLNYAANAVVLFQRGTVMAADCVLYYGVHRFTRGMPPPKRLLVSALVVLSPGLFMVDHIHFQYNGFLFGILLLSLSALRDSKDLRGGVLFAILVCTKHLFAVAGPAYFVYLLKHHVVAKRSLANFVTLGVSVLAVVGTTFGPFAALGQMGQVLERLFPFGRGLTHAYWAPNAWALYNALDKVLATVLGRGGRGVATFAGGLVGEGGSNTHLVLPQVSPRVTAVLVLLAMAPCLAHTWRHAKPSLVVRTVAHALLCGFMFGWHVHEKAALTFIIPMALIAADSKQDARAFLFVATVTQFSLFPLLYQWQEYPIKWLLFLIYTLAAWAALEWFFESQPSSCDDPSSSSEQSGPVETGPPEGSSLVGFCGQLLSPAEFTFLLGLGGVELFCQLVHPFVFGERLPFLPLMLVSVYCAVGFVGQWVREMRRFVLSLRRGYAFEDAPVEKDL